MVTNSELEKLIELVKNSPPLYDVTMAEYKDAAHTENLWLNVAEKMQREDISGK